MHFSSNTILITGGASGIGLALAERFLRTGNRLVVCGRRESALKELEHRHPEVETRVCDVAEAAEREALAAWAVERFPSLNVLVNNAGIQRRAQLSTEHDWAAVHQEIAINFDAQVHLTLLLLPHFINQQRATIMNVTSALAFVPLVETAVYSATKAACHSFTLSLRHQLAKTAVEVVEIIPPAVDTDLGGPGLHTFGVKVDEFADAAMKQLAEGAREITYGFSKQSSRASREELDAIFQRMNASAD